MKCKPRVKDLTGLRFGKLVVKEQAGFHVKPKGKRTAKWLCICDCGNTHITQGSILVAGDCNSCGCIISEKLPRFTYLYTLPIVEKSDKSIRIIWQSIKERLENRQAYLDCTISGNFQNFEFFLGWYRNQSGSNLGWEIDKDLLIRGNRQYGENTCILLPKEINMALSSQKSSRGDLPRGVTYDKNSGKYSTKCSMGNNKQKYLGRFDCPIDAFNAYKKFKELLLKSLAFKYKKWLDPRAYDTLMSYEITIDS